MKMKNSESGRSLIEIIAILIIMAILLIAALLGFKALLDYLKYKQTSDEVAVVATRYKLKKLQARKSVDGRVRIKDFYPEGIDCNPPSKECVATPDGGKLGLISGETSAFAVIVEDIKCVSCREIVEIGAFGMIIPQVLTALGEDTELDGYNPKDAREKVERICLNQGGEACTGTEKVMGLSLIFGNECDSGAKYIVGGKCSFCKKGKIRALQGNISRGRLDDDGCCDADKVHCGYCGGCPEDDTPDFKLCVNGRCRECDPDQNYPDGKNNKCIAKYGSYAITRPYCVDGFCKPCINKDEPCFNSSGATIGGMFCDFDLECKELCKKCYEPDPAVPGTCKLIIPLGTAPDDTCNPDENCPQCETPMSCDHMEDGSDKCQCPSPINEGDACSDICPCTDGSECRNDICTQPSDCSGLEEEAKRFFGKGCIPNDCPCASDLLICPGDTKVCKCDSLPISVDAKCWGECGCGYGLKCKNTSGTDLSTLSGDDKAVEGTCQCESDGEFNQACTATCPCSSTTVSDTDNRALLVCYDDEITDAEKTKILFFNSEAQKYTCQCNPAIEKHTLAAGSHCVQDCDQCQTGLICTDDNICGCQTDADCSDNCDGRTDCDETTNTCVCDISRSLVSGGDGKCYCESETTPGTADKSKSFWRIPKTDTESRPTRYLCCPSSQIPYEISSDTYECRRICTGSEVRNVVILLDYSNSLEYKDPSDNVKKIAKNIIEEIESFNGTLPDDKKVSISVYREDLSGCLVDGLPAAPRCDSGSTSVSSSNLDATALCGCNIRFQKRNGQDQGGGTTFEGGIGAISDKDHTLVIMISDGYVPDKSFDSWTAEQKQRVHVIAEGYSGNDWQLPTLHRWDFGQAMAEDFSDNILKTVKEALCVSPADAENLTSNWVCNPTEST